MEDSRERSPSVEKYFMTNKEMVDLCHELARHIRNSKEEFTHVYGVPRGGYIPAVYLAHMLDLPIHGSREGRSDAERYLIVEDVVDTGETVRWYRDNVWTYECDIIVALVGKSWTNPTADYVAKIDDRWIVFPWEKD